MGCLVRSKLEIMRKIGEGRPERVALGNGVLQPGWGTEVKEPEGSMIFGG